MKVIRVLLFVLAAAVVAYIFCSCEESGSTAGPADQYQSDTGGPISCALCRADDWKCLQDCIPQEDAMSPDNSLPDASEGDAMSGDESSVDPCAPYRWLEAHTWMCIGDYPSGDIELQLLPEGGECYISTKLFKLPATSTRIHLDPPNSFVYHSNGLNQDFQCVPLD